MHPIAKESPNVSEEPLVGDRRGFELIDGRT